MNISDRVSRYRKACGLTQEQLAEAVGVEVQTVYGWETDGPRPDMGNIIALSRVFGISTNSLLVGIESSESDSMPAHDMPEKLEELEDWEEDEIGEDEELGQIALEFSAPELDGLTLFPARKRKKMGAGTTAAIIAMGVLAVAGSVVVAALAARRHTAANKK